MNSQFTETLINVADKISKLKSEGKPKIVCLCTTTRQWVDTVIYCKGMCKAYNELNENLFYRIFLSLSVHLFITAASDKRL